MILRTLGRLVLEGSSLTRPRPLLLLAYVVLQGGATRRELADLFFMHASDPRDSLSAAVGQVRRAAPGLVTLDATTVTSTVECDALALLSEFDDNRFESVVRRYGGPFCAGFDQPLGEELEEWLYSTREEIASRVRSALFHVARVAAADGRLDDARHSVARALGLDEAPELESAEVAALLPLLRGIGSTDLARMEQLAAELEVEPRRVDAAAVLASTFPQRAAPSSPFIGRAAELSALRGLLTSPGERIITLWGLGGIGKSRLADRVADMAVAELGAAFPDGVHRVPLETVPSALDVELAVATRLGFSADALGVEGGLVSLLRNWRALLVLDNFEHLLDASQLVGAIAASCPGVTLLVTSRVRLALAGERIFALGGLALAADGAGDSDAARLFLDRAGRAGLGSDLTAAERDEVGRLCEALEGYPLGIELAAGMVRVLPLAKLRSEVGRSLQVLGQGPVDAPERHRAVSAAFEPSWRRLSRKERDAARRLSVFSGGCDLEAAQAVARADLAVLGGLVDKAVVRHDARSGRFGFHPLIREFVSERLPDAVYDEARLAHRDHFAGLLDRAAAAYPHAPDEVLTLVAADIDNVRSAIRWSLRRGDAGSAVSMLVRLVYDCDYLEARGGTVSLVELMEEGAARAEEAGDHAAANRLLARAGDAHRHFAAGPDAALRTYREALRLAELSHEAPRQVALLGVIGAMLVNQDRDEALSYLDRARAVARSSGDELLECDVLTRVGYVAHALGDLEGMRAANLEAHGIGRRLLRRETDADRVRRAEAMVFFALHNLGVVEDDTGHLEAAGAYRLDALRFAEERGHRLWVGYAAEELALMHARSHDVASAEAYAEIARTQYGGTGAESSLSQFRERWEEALAAAADDSEASGDA